MSLSLTKEIPRYVIKYLGLLVSNIDDIININVKYKVLIVKLESNINIEDSPDMAKNTKLLKIMKNTLDRGYVYSLSIKKVLNDFTIIIKSHFIPINKSYCLEFKQNIFKNEAKISINEIVETDFTPLYPQVYHLGYYIFKNDTKENLSKYLNSSQWKNKDLDFENHLYNMRFSSILKENIDNSLKVYNKEIKLDSEITLNIKMYIKDDFKDFSNKIYEITNTYFVLNRKIKDNLYKLALIIRIQDKFYYFSYSFKEKIKHNYDELQTICYKIQKYKLFEFESFDDLGYIRTKNFYYFLNNKVEDTSTYLNTIYFDITKNLDIMKNFEKARLEKDKEN